MIDVKGIGNYQFVTCSIITGSHKDHQWILKSLGERLSGNKIDSWCPKNTYRLLFTLERGRNKSFIVENSGSKPFIHMFKRNMTNSTQYHPIKHSYQESLT